MKQLMSHLEAILRQCRELCALVQRLADGSVGVEAASTALRGISRELRLKQRIMYTIMQSSKLGSRAPALRQLVTRLNYNGFADRQAAVRPGGAPAGGAARPPAQGGASDVEP